MIRQELETPLAKALLAGTFQENDTILVSLREEGGGGEEEGEAGRGGGRGGKGGALELAKATELSRDAQPALSPSP